MKKILWIEQVQKPPEIWRFFYCHFLFLSFHISPILADSRERPAFLYAFVAQQVAQRFCNPKVAGSIPVRSTTSGMMENI